MSAENGMTTDIMIKQQCKNKTNFLLVKKTYIVLSKEAFKTFLKMIQ